MLEEFWHPQDLSINFNLLTNKSSNPSPLELYTHKTFHAAKFKNCINSTLATSPDICSTCVQHSQEKSLGNMLYFQITWGI